MATDTTVKLAVLIDADNARPGVAVALLAEVAKLDGAEIAFSYETPGLAPLRQAFARFVADNRDLFLKDDRNRQTISKFPELEVAVSTGPRE
jgi:hypothetical protein